MIYRKRKAKNCYTDTVQMHHLIPSRHCKTDTCFV